jgi:hypothetical protein
MSESSPGDIPTTPALPEPDAATRRGAITLGALYVAYRQAGFDRDQAFGLITMHLAAALGQAK